MKDAVIMNNNKLKYECINNNIANNNINKTEHMHI